jgi:hypothetical protein
MSTTTFDPLFFRGNPEEGPGWRPETPHFEDKVFAASSYSYPSNYSLIQNFPDAFQEVVEDQIPTSSCVGNAATILGEFIFRRDTKKKINLARLLTYWGARSYRGWQNKDSGCFIRDAFRWMSEVGLALESFYEFKTENLYLTPSQAVLEQAGRHKLVDGTRVARGDVLKVIASGSPVVGGFSVYRDPVFGAQAQTTGFIRLPKTLDIPGGGHAVCFTWYDEALGLIGGPNSWGPRWGQQNRVRPGWFEMPLDYIYNENLSDDFWTATKAVL